MIDRGVHIYIYIYMCLWSKKNFESYFRDRLTFSNVDSRTSRRIYRLALLLRAPETLSSLSKSRISIFNAHLTLLVRKMTSHNSIGKYKPLLSGLLRCGHLPLPDIIKNRVVFVLFVFVKSIWAGHPVWSRARAWRLSHYTPCYIISF